MIFRKHVTLLAQVWRQSFWMRGWGSKTPKRTSLWSNSFAIRKFQTASKFSRAIKAGRELADVYYDRAGQKRYKGNKRLKQSQPDTQFTLAFAFTNCCTIRFVQFIMGYMSHGFQVMIHQGNIRLAMVSALPMQ